jgi:hypothetical protein
VSRQIFSTLGEMLMLGAAFSGARGGLHFDGYEDQKFHQDA